MPGKIPRSCTWIPEKNVFECIGKKGTTYRDPSGFPISSETLAVKEEKLAEMIDIGKTCIESGKCKKNIDLILYELESCPSCAAHKPIIENIVNRFSQANIPINIASKQARDNLKAFEKAGCTGTPCIVSSRNSKKIYEGNIGEISAMAKMLGMPNPLFKNIKNATPKMLR